MADTALSALVAKTVLVAADELYLNDSAVSGAAASKKVTVQNLAQSGSPYMQSRVIGSPTYNLIWQMFDTVLSSGTVHDNAIAITDGGSGTVDITAGQGWIRNGDTDVSPLFSFDWAAVTGLALTD